MQQHHKLLALVEQLPDTDNSAEWADAFAHLLCILLVDVDRANVTINAQYSLTENEIAIADLIEREHTRRRAPPIPGVPDGGIDTSASGSDPTTRAMPAASLLEYHCSDGRLVGSISLWREMPSQRKLSRATVATLVSSKRLITQLLLARLAHSDRANAERHAFARGLARIQVSARLSVQQLRVIILLCSGLSNKETADELQLSLDGIKYHIRVIHERTETHTFNELVAQLFLLLPLHLRAVDSASDATVNSHVLWRA